MLPFRPSPPRGPPRRKPHERVLAAWRGYPWEFGDFHTTAAVHVGATVPVVLSSVRIDKRRAEAEVVKVWNNLLDPNIVAHAQPVGLNKQGTLFVSVDSSVWLSEIVRYRRKEILDRLRTSFGREFIRKISFRVG